MLEEKLMKFMMMDAEIVRVGPDYPQGTFFGTLDSALLFHDWTKFDGETKWGENVTQIVAYIASKKLGFEPGSLFFLFRQALNKREVEKYSFKSEVYCGRIRNLIIIL